MTDRRPTMWPPGHDRTVTINAIIPGSDPMPLREDTTTFDGGVCARCGWPEHLPAENGQACGKCGRRVVFGKVER